jgi:hypothetical protein
MPNGKGASHRAANGCGITGITAFLPQKWSRRDAMERGAIQEDGEQMMSLCMFHYDTPTKPPRIGASRLPD